MRTWGVHGLAVSMGWVDRSQLRDDDDVALQMGT